MPFSQSFCDKLFKFWALSCLHGCRYHTKVNEQIFNWEQKQKQNYGGKPQQSKLQKTNRELWIGRLKQNYKHMYIGICI